MKLGTGFYCDDILITDVYPVTSELESGLYEKEKYCCLDGILREIISIRKKDNLFFIKTPFDYIVSDGKVSAHAENLKKAKDDYLYKLYANSLEHKKLKLTDKVDIKLYRTITGACELGVNEWMQKTNVKEGISVKDLLEVFKENPGYGMEKFKELVEE